MVEGTHLHWSQPNGFSCEWVPKWQVRCDRCEKRLLHSGHAYGRSPVCVLRWVRKLVLIVVLYSHTSHEWTTISLRGAVAVLEADGQGGHPSPQNTKTLVGLRKSQASQRMCVCVCASVASSARGDRRKSARSLAWSMKRERVPADVHRASRWRWGGVLCASAFFFWSVGR